MMRGGIRITPVDLLQPPLNVFCAQNLWHVQPIVWCVCVCAVCWGAAGEEEMSHEILFCIDCY